MPAPSIVTADATAYANHYKSQLVTADTAVFSGKGYIHTITLMCNDALRLPVQ